MYARFTDTGVDPKEAAKRLNIDWDSAAQIEDAETEESEVPPAVVGFPSSRKLYFAFRLDTSPKRFLTLGHR